MNRARRTPPGGSRRLARGPTIPAVSAPMTTMDVSDDERLTMAAELLSLTCVLIAAKVRRPQPRPATEAPGRLWEHSNGWQGTRPKNAQFLYSALRPGGHFLRPPNFPSKDFSGLPTGPGQGARPKDA